MAVKVFGHAGAMGCKRVIMTLDELNVPYEVVLVDLMKGEQKQADFLARNPFGKIPAIEDEDGTRVFESRAICKYLAKKHAGKAKLLPEESDLVACARFEEACDFELSYFDKYASSVVYEVIFTPMMGGQTDQEVVKGHLTNLDNTLKAYDQILADRKFIAGDAFTVADIFHTPYGKAAQGVGAKELFDKYPNVKRWWSEVMARDSCKALDASFP